MSPEEKRRGSYLADWKKKESEKTGEELDKALNRFKSGKLIRLPKGSKLTRSSLAAEACVAKDTPFSRYRKGHPKAGQYRFPQVVERFNNLREKRRAKPKGKTGVDEIARWKNTADELDAMLRASRRVVNAQDIEIDKCRRRCRELEELTEKLGVECDGLKAEVMKLRRQRIKEIP